MLDEAAVQRLRCPITLGKLSLATDDLIARVNRMIEAGGLPTRGGQTHGDVVQAGLVTADRGHLYPIQDGIVCMLVENAIVLETVNETPE